MSKYIYRQAGLGIYPGQTAPNQDIVPTTWPQRFLGPKVVALELVVVVSTLLTCMYVGGERCA